MCDKADLYDVLGDINHYSDGCVWTFKGLPVVFIRSCWWGLTPMREG